MNALAIKSTSQQYWSSVSSNEFLSQLFSVFVRVTILQPNHYTGTSNVWFRCVQLCSFEKKLRVLKNKLYSFEMTSNSETK